MKNEYYLILLSVLKNKKVEESLQIDNYLKQQLDWSEIVGQVINHRLGGYFYYGLTEMQLKKIPKEFKAALKMLANGQEMQAKKRIKEFIIIDDILVKNSIAYFGLKGLIFSTNIYGLKERRSNDLDLMVHENDLDKLDIALRSIGYIQSNIPNGELIEATKKEKLIQRMNYHDLVPYVKEVDGEIIEIDINFKFDSKEHEIDDSIFDYGVQRYSGNGYEVNGLPFNTNLLFLCIHFYREATNTLWVAGRRDVVLYKLVDIMNYMRVYNEQFDVQEWCNLAHKLDLEKKCYFTFHMLSLFYGENCEKIEQVLNILKVDDLSFIDEIYVESEHKTILREKRYDESAFDWKY